MVLIPATRNTEGAIKALVHKAVEDFAIGFQNRHTAERKDPEGTINMKIHNAFIAALGSEIQYYTAMVRSFDSSLGNMLEALAIKIAELSYDVKRNVEGPLTVNQTRKIAELLEAYKSTRPARKPLCSDYAFLRSKPTEQTLVTKRHDSDYYLTDKQTNRHYLIELKIGGDLDNKKARSEKEALLEQYAILSNIMPLGTEITVHFATAYNRFGEEKVWNQGRVLQYFSPEELLIGRDFWKFICHSDQGYRYVMEAYQEKAHLIHAALDALKKLYLG